MVCNRDERRTRPPALDPVLQTIGDRTALFPMDPVSRGTWIGINDAGLALALLNRTMPGPRRRPLESRGAIVPALLRHASLQAVVTHALALDARRFDLFRLVAIQGSAAAVLTSNGCRVWHERPDTAAPLMFTSSSLGDACVQRARGRLFERLVVNGRGGWIEGQQLFHQHVWPRRPAVSVLMNRPDARTVSRTVVTVAPGRVSLDYEALDRPRARAETLLAGAA